jgi:hypothetical protein
VPTTHYSRASVSKRNHDLDLSARRFGPLRKSGDVSCGKEKESSDDCRDNKGGGAGQLESRARHSVSDEVRCLRGFG